MAREEDRAARMRKRLGNKKVPDFYALKGILNLVPSACSLSGISFEPFWLRIWSPIIENFDDSLFIWVKIFLNSRTDMVLVQCSCLALGSVHWVVLCVLCVLCVVVFCFKFLSFDYRNSLKFYSTEITHKI